LGTLAEQTLDLNSGFWQMKFDEDSQPLTAFTIPGMGQFAWVTIPMGLLLCAAIFQHLMEAILRKIKNVLVWGYVTSLEHTLKIMARLVDFGCLRESLDDVLKVFDGG